MPQEERPAENVIGWRKKKSEPLKPVKHPPPSTEKQLAYLDLLIHKRRREGITAPGGWVSEFWRRVRLPDRLSGMAASCLIDILKEQEAESIAQNARSAVYDRRHGVADIRINRIYALLYFSEACDYLESLS